MFRTDPCEVCSQIEDDVIEADIGQIDLVSVCSVLISYFLCFRSRIESALMNRAPATYGKPCEFTKALKKAVDEYFEKTNRARVGGWVIWTEAAVALILYLTPLMLLYIGVVSSIWWALGLGLVMGIGFLMVGADVMHAANHGTLSKYPRVNRVFSYSMELLGMSSRNWKVQHNDLHHMHTNVVGQGGDSDLTAGEPWVRYAVFSNLKSKMIRYQHIYVWVVYSFAFILWIFNKDFQAIGEYHKEGFYRRRPGSKPSKARIVWEMIGFKLAYVLIFLGLPILFGSNPLYVIVMWLTATMFAGAVMMPIFQMAHAVPEVQQFETGQKMDVSWMVHQIRTSADVRLSNPFLNKIFTHLVGGLNYQKVHHAFRDISHVHYPDLSKIVDQYVEKYKIESVTFYSLRDALSAHGRLMRKLGRLPELNFN